MHSQAKCWPRTKHAVSASCSGIFLSGLERLARRFEAMFMTSPMPIKRMSWLGTPAALGRIDGERKPWPMWEKTA